MSTKFGLLIDFDLLKAAISANAKPEIVMLRFGRHIALSRWRPRQLNTISDFAFVDIAAFRNHSLWANQILSTYRNWWLRYNYFHFLKKNKRFRFRPFARNLHIILHQATELCPNRSIHCGNMTSYPFLKMAAPTAKYYFRFRICWCHCLQKVKVY